MPRRLLLGALFDYFLYVGKIVLEGVHIKTLVLYGKVQLTDRHKDFETDLIRQHEKMKTRGGKNSEQKLPLLFPPHIPSRMCFVSK